MTGSFAAALLIPAYNAECFIGDILGDAARQTVPFEEIIVYDDASTDNTTAIAEQHGARVIRGEVNGGAAVARNRLIAATSCDWVHFHDADDRLMADFLATVGPLARSTQTHVLCAQRAIRAETGVEVSIVRHAEIANDPLAYFIRQVAGYSSIGLYRRDKLQAVGGFDERLRGNEDPDLHVRLALAGNNFAWCEAVLSINVLRADSFSGSNWLRCMTDRLDCLERYETASLTPQQRASLGAAALWTANQLWRRGDRARARRGIALAGRCGMSEIDSPRWLTRKLSRIVGLEATFWARSLKARLSGAS